MDEFRCNSTNKCISIKFWCDGDDDCGDLSDEVNCGNKTSKFVYNVLQIVTCWNYVVINYYAVQCSTNKFSCASSNKCVLNSYKCDGDNDCGDLSDETNCGIQTSMAC